MGKQYEIREISIEQIEPNPWNPNEQDDKTFGVLTQELDPDEGVGYIDLIQVVPLEDDRYRIIGGEHRWRGLRALGEEVADCVVLIDPKWQDEDLQKFVTMRLNSIKGKIDPQKFLSLYNDLADRYEEEDMQRHMAVTDDNEWNSLMKVVRKNLEGALDGLEGDDKKKGLEDFDKAAKGAKTVEELSEIINKIISEFGDTLDQHFIWFSFGGKKHLSVTMGASDWKVAKKLIDIVKKKGLLADEVFASMMSDWVKLNQ